MRHPVIINLVLLSLSFNLLRTPMHWRDSFTAYAKNLSHVLLFYRSTNEKFQRVNVRAIWVCCKRIHPINSPHITWPLHTQITQSLNAHASWLPFLRKSDSKFTLYAEIHLTRKRENLPENGLLILFCLFYWLLRIVELWAAKLYLPEGTFPWFGTVFIGFIWEPFQLFTILS